MISRWISRATHAVRLRDKSGRGRVSRKVSIGWRAAGRGDGRLPCGETAVRLRWDSSEMCGET